MLSEKPWKPERVVLLLLATAACFAWFSMAWGVFQHYKIGVDQDENSLVYLLFATLSLHGSILLATGLVLWWFRLDWREAFGFSRRDVWRSVLLGALAAGVFLPAGWMLQELSARFMNLLHREVPVQQAVQTLQQVEKWDCQVYFVVFSILIAPAAEEILFRGVLYPAVKQLGFPRTALWGTAMLFAAVHWNLPIFLPLLALGLALALLYEFTNNLLACITAHGVFNAANIVVFYLQQSSPHGHG